LFEETGRTDLPGGSKEKLKQSLDVLNNILYDGAIILSGHGEMFIYKK